MQASKCVIALYPGNNTQVAVQYTNSTAVLLLCHGILLTGPDLLAASPSRWLGLLRLSLFYFAASGDGKD